jgi:eukaryotic-like serine/threonine-protein kinase
MSLEPGELIEGKYRIVRLLGMGGMGAVYEGENVRIHRRVAIKVLHAGIAENAEAVARFEREAQAAGRIGSERIVGVLDLGDLPNGERFMVMEYLEGDSLSQRVKDHGRIAPAQLRPIMCQLLDGLEAAHNAGIIHRDLKPDNVFLLRAKEGDFVKILDFGISKFNALGGDPGFKMTKTGAVMGTPYYLSPEQAKGAKEVDQRADLYAAGVILYECVTGHVPFDAETFNGLIMKIAFETPVPPETLSPEVDRAFGSIIAKAMARDPAERFQSAAQFRQALESWAATGACVSVPPSAGIHLPPTPIPPAPPAPQLGGTAGAWAASQNMPPPPPKKSRVLPIAIATAVGAVALVAVAGVFWMRMSGGVTPAASAAEPESSAPIEAPLEPSSPPSASAADPTPQEEPPASASAPAEPPPAAKPRVAAVRPTAKAPESTAAAPPPPAPPVKPPPAPTGTGGRKIRTDL